jgi:protein O-GlcNAc transferase
VARFGRAAFEDRQNHLIFNAECRAIELARQPEKLASVKRKLDDNRLTTPMFDTALFTRHMETAYAMMVERHHAGLAPDGLVIPA